MAGKFINNDQKITLDLMSSNMTSLLNNPYYLYSDKKGSSTQYYNINVKKTTLDEASRTNYSELGPQSPIRYNLIKNAILYGLSKIDIDLDIGENGLSSADIDGEAIILPNTFKPYPNDFFTIDHLNKPYLFMVTAVNQNTLDTGAVLYKINYKLVHNDLHGIDKQVVQTFNFMLNNVGTDLNAVITEENYDLIEKLEAFTVLLKDYFNMIFYDEKVQTYTYLHEGMFKVYDPYLIEFMIRNKILKGASKYTYITQQMILPSTFGINYMKTIFNALEEKEISDTTKFIFNLYVVDQRTSLLYAYPEDYYYAEYNYLTRGLFDINMFNNLNILDDIKNINYGDSPLINIIIKFFNDIKLDDEDLSNLKKIDYGDNKELYYGIPMCIYCIENIIINLLK